MTEPQPTLSDGTVWLTPWRPDDDVAIGDFNIDPDHRRWFDQPDPDPDPVARRAHGAEVVRRWERGWIEGIGRTFALREEPNGPAIGMAELQPRPSGAANISYAVVPSHRRRGYATRAVRLLSTAGLTRFGYVRIELRCDTENTASRGVAESAGFSLEGNEPSGVFENVVEWRGTTREERVYARSLDPKQIVRDGYGTIGASYRPWSEAGGGETRAWFLAVSLARIPAGADVLELGCGPGVDALTLAEGRRYTGVDISPVMIAIAREQVPAATFIEHDLASLDLPEGSFDAVVSLYVFGHLPSAEHRPTIERVHGWLRPGGVFCASFPMGADDDVEDDWIGAPMFFGGIGRDATIAALRDGGFDLELEETRDDTDADMQGESFLWVIARKPAVRRA
jgi:RimJ/RimL family protein N-acetyltransferase/SAM-dependent methyltransferase